VLFVQVDGSNSVHALLFEVICALLNVPISRATVRMIRVNCMASTLKCDRESKREEKSGLDIVRVFE
jgi:hypothetical protein